MKTLCGRLVAVVLLVAVTGQARADFIGTITIEGTATGSLGDTSFKDALVTFTGTYNTADITEHVFPPWPEPPHATPIEWTAPLESAAVNVSGIGSATILASGTAGFYSAFQIRKNPPAQLSLTFFPSDLPLYVVAGGLGSQYWGNDLTQSVGPVQLSFGLPLPPIGTVATSEGSLTITGINFNDWTGQVDVVPEPSSLILLSLGLLCLLGYGWRRKRMVAASA
jgi:hypothetical protein